MEVFCADTGGYPQTRFDAAAPGTGWPLPDDFWAPVFVAVDEPALGRAQLKAPRSTVGRRADNLCYVR